MVYKSEIGFENSDSFAVEVVAHIEEKHLGVYLYINGLHHPLDKGDWNYIGEETKNPQLKAATDLVEKIFYKWADQLDPEVRSRMELTRLRNYGTANKSASLASGYDNPPPSPSVVEHISDNLAVLDKMILAGKEEIEAALIEGKAIELEDPYEKIRLGQIRVFASLSHPGICEKSTAKAIFETMAADKIISDEELLQDVIEALPDGAVVGIRPKTEPN